MSKVSSLFLWAVLITIAMGCQSKPSESKQPAATPVSPPSAEKAAPDSSATPSAQAGSTPTPEAPNACRAPMEPGCNPCCEPQTDGSCAVRSWNAGSLTQQELAGVTPWYNQSGFQDGACPGQCRPCARCTQRAASELQQLGKRPECDCSKPTGIDSCMTPGACGCYCLKRKQLTLLCPELAKQQPAPANP